MGWLRWFNHNNGDSIMETYTLVYNLKKKKVLMFELKGNNVTTTAGASTLFEGTREECLNKIKELGLQWDGGE